MSQQNNDDEGLFGLGWLEEDADGSTCVRCGETAYLRHYRLAMFSGTTAELEEGVVCYLCITEDEVAESIKLE